MIPTGMLSVSQWGAICEVSDMNTEKVEVAAVVPHEHWGAAHAFCRVALDEHSFGPTQPGFDNCSGYPGNPTEPQNRFYEVLIAV